MSGGKVTELIPKNSSDYERFALRFGIEAADAMIEVWQRHIKDVLKMWDDERRGYGVALDAMHSRGERVKRLEALLHEVLALLDLRDEDRFEFEAKKTIARICDTLEAKP